MTSKKNKSKDLFITEISEEDFRKLDLIGYKQEKVSIPGYDSSAWHYEMKEVRLNSVLDREIKLSLESGCEFDYEELQIPVTIAIHRDDDEDNFPYYLDKYMNRFTGPISYQFGWGIKHLYSTRDYFEDGEDYWRVPKKETKAIYRVHLDKKWLDKFQLKHKTVKIDWPYSKEDIPEGATKCELHINYEINPETGEETETSRTKVVYFQQSKQYIPVDKDGNEKKRE